MDQHDRITKEIELLKKKLARCFEKRLLTDDPEKEIDLETLEEKLDAEIKQKEQLLNQIPDSRISKNRSAIALEESLWNVDFTLPKKLVRDATDNLTQKRGGSVLLLVERCFEMEGRLLLKSIRNILESNTNQFFEYPVEFIPTMPANKAAFLKTLGGHLGISFGDEFSDESAQGILAFTEKIVESISRLLRSGTTVFISLTNWQSLGAEEQVHFLDWFMNTFWKTLVDAVSKALVNYSPKVFFVIMADSNLSVACQKDEYFCNAQDFDNRKILNLPMTLWCQSDISLWLDNYSSRLDKLQRDRLVSYIFDGKNEELPIKIRVALERAYAQSIF